MASIDAGLSGLFNEVLAASNHQSLPDADATAARVVRDMADLEPAARLAFADLAAALPEDLRRDVDVLQRSSLAIFAQIVGVHDLAGFRTAMAALPATVGSAVEQQAGIAATRIDRYTQDRCGIGIIEQQTTPGGVSS